mmetsp:Transcript_12878/g.32633  ORF Transcript_12878/g.32633 Transcript_12878/m.32633 type:complete len:249 (+) Transcript_12878:30-776(+)
MENYSGRPAAALARRPRPRLRARLRPQIAAPKLSKTGAIHPYRHTHTASTVIAPNPSHKAQSTAAMSTVEAVAGLITSCSATQTRLPAEKALIGAVTVHVVETSSAEPTTMPAGVAAMNKKVAIFCIRLEGPSASTAPKANAAKSLCSPIKAPSATKSLVFERSPSASPSRMACTESPHVAATAASGRLSCCWRMPPRLAHESSRTGGMCVCVPLQPCFCSSKWLPVSTCVYGSSESSLACSGLPPQV